MKGTFGRVTRGPHAYMKPNTVVGGILSRSVRDVARYYDVVAGVDPWDPSTLESDGKWEANLGKSTFKGKKVAVIPNLCGVTLEDGVAELIHQQAELLIKDLGLVKVDINVKPPNLAAYWMMENLVTLIGELGNLWPRRAKDMTDEVAMGLLLAQAFYNLKSASLAEMRRIEANEEMARAFEEVDYIIAATNPGPAFPAESTKSNQKRDLLDILKENTVIKNASKSVLYGARVISSFNQKLPIAILDQAANWFPEMMEMGALTMISNVYGNPAISIPVGSIDSLPVGMQVLAPHHRDSELLDIALEVERNRPWPLHAPVD
jgi:aspartyl-tRNA(Asn)/glutamyl-tRNA(Gln) amidotransferase subunit A